MTAEEATEAAVAAPTTEAAVKPLPVVRGWLLDPRLPAFWLVVGLIGVGGWQIGGLIRLAVSAYPLPSLVALALFTLYAIPFIAVVRSLDYLEEEPPVLLTVAFLWGGVVATSQAIPANAAVRDILAGLVSPRFADVWGPAISAPLVEEILKLLGVVAIVLLARVHINSTLDGFVYGALVGLGFQVVENFVYAVNAVAHADHAGSRDWISPLLGSFVARGFIAGLWSHTMFTALAGAGVGYAVMRTERTRARRYGVAVLAFAGAWAFHFGWDTPWLGDGFGFGIGGVVAVLVLKGLPGLVVVLLLVRAALRHEAAYYTTLLRRSGDLRLITPDEVPMLVKGRNRLAARRHARSLRGLRGALAVHRLQRAQARYAVELSRHVDGARGSGGEGVGARRTHALRRREVEVRNARQRINALGIELVTAPEGALHGWTGLASILCGLFGVFFPPALAISAALAAGGLLVARHRRELADSWLVDGLMISGIGTGLWLLSLFIFGTGGR
ncbi:MAG: PrsW family intramembrane metalloprotease [Micromonosporaceae bacterium]